MRFFRRVALTAMHYKPTPKPKLTSLTDVLLEAFTEIQNEAIDYSIDYAECFLAEALYLELLSEAHQAASWQREKFPNLAASQVFQYYGVYFKRDIRLRENTAQFLVEFKYQGVRPEGRGRRTYNLEVA